MGHNGHMKRQNPPKNLGKALQQGYVPMFMTGAEILKHANLGDAGQFDRTKVGEPKPKEQKAKEADIMDFKLQESRTGPEDNARDLAFPYETTLLNSVREKGLKEPFPLIWKNKGFNDPAIEKKGSVNVVQGHHRLATINHLNPNQFHAVHWRAFGRSL